MKNRELNNIKGLIELGRTKSGISLTTVEKMIEFGISVEEVSSSLGKSSLEIKSILTSNDKPFPNYYMVADSVNKLTLKKRK